MVTNKRKNYPKKALTAYNIFFKDTREKIIIEHGRIDFQELARIIAALWKEASHADKVRFDAMASKDMERYKEEVKQYEQRIVEENESNKKQKITNPMQKDESHLNSVSKKMKTHSHGDESCLTYNQKQVALQELNNQVGHQAIPTFGANLRGESDSIGAAEMQLRRRSILGMGYVGGVLPLPTEETTIGFRRFGGGHISFNNELSSSYNEFRRGTSLNRDGLSMRNRIERRTFQSTNGVNHAAVPDTIKSKYKFSGGSDSSAAPTMEKPSAAVFEEEEIRNLVREAMVRFGSSRIDAKEGDSTTEIRKVRRPESDFTRDEKESRKDLNLGNQIAIPDANLISKTMASNDLNSDFRTWPSGEHQTRLAMMDEHKLATHEVYNSAQQLFRMDTVLEEIRLQEKLVSRRKRIFDQWFQSAQWRRSTFDASS